MPAPLARLLGYQLQDEVGHADAVKRIDEAFRAKHGNATQAAKLLGVSWRALMDWVAQYDDLRAKLDEARRSAGAVPRSQDKPLKSRAKEAQRIEARISASRKKRAKTKAKKSR